MENNDKFNKESVTLLLDTAKSSYDDEHNRTQIIDSKANISLPIISAFVVTTIQSMNYKAIVSLPSTSFLLWLIPFLLFTTYSVSLAASACSAFFMTRVILMRDYRSIKPRDLYDENYLKNNIIPYSFEMISLYIQACEFNKIQNDKRVKLYKLGWRLAFVSLASYILYFVFNNLFF